MVGNAASPLTAFLIAPLAEPAFMALMTDGVGADLIGGWFGTCPDPGIALLFTLAGLAGVVVTSGPGRPAPTGAWRPPGGRRRALRRVMLD